MTIVNTYSAESWEKVYSAFQQINFTSYDYDTVKESLLQYLQIYYSEDYNDFIESAELISILELFAYAAELLAYRTDAVAHENFMPTAQRKQSVLRLAKLISYSASRNIPARGLVKINTIRTNEVVYDSLGNNLSGQTIMWNDPNNSNWKEQFFLVVNACLTTRFGQPSKSFQIGDVLMQQYTFNNTFNSFRNGVFAFAANSSSDSVAMEVVPLDLDENGPYERAPDGNAQFNIAYASDGRGDGSDYTGFMMFVKQGSMILTTYEISEAIANRRMTLNQNNVNDTDVWVYQVNDAGTITQKWQRVDSLSDQTLAFNTLPTRYKYEVETLENDQIALIFGDGNFSEIPKGRFQLWTRTSVNQTMTIPKNRINGQQMSFNYRNAQNASFECVMTFSLTSALQNNAQSESIEHIRQSAPSAYYSQNRMVNAQDHNTFMLKDSTILKLSSINRTFAGQPKYLDWNDASGKYQNVKLFGDDLKLSMKIGVNSVSTTSASKGIIDNFIEPVLSTNSILNVLTYQLAAAAPEDEFGNVELNRLGAGIVSFPRNKFIEDNRKLYKDIDGNNVTPYGYHLDGTTDNDGEGSLLEKSAIQGALDGHWYGEPKSTVVINNAIHGVIDDPILNPKSSSKLYLPNLPRTIDGVNTYPPGDTGSGLQPVSRQQYFGLKFNRFLKTFGDGYLKFADGATDQTSQVNGLPWIQSQYEKAGSIRVETLTVELLSDGTTFSVISNIRGQLPSYSAVLAASTANGLWSEQTTEQLPVDFSIIEGATAFESGDSFVIDILFDGAWKASLREFGSNYSVNLTGWWQIIPTDVVNDTTEQGLGLFTSGYSNGPSGIQQMIFDQSQSGNSWIFLIARKDDANGETQEWTIYNRDAKIIASSATTKFWFNQAEQIIDSETRKPVYDKIRILRSNLDEFGLPLRKADIYDCVGFVYDENGEIVPNSIEILPTNAVDFTNNGNPVNILQFENFARNSYQYSLYRDQTGQPSDFVRTIDCSEIKSVVIGYDDSVYDVLLYDVGATITIGGLSMPFQFQPGHFASVNSVDGYRLVREFIVPSPIGTNEVTGSFGCNETKGLDFMWQHFTPDVNLIDPSVSNIHDTYILTSGYYSSVMDYVRGLSKYVPQPPTPLELRTSYGYLLENKMMSDTIVLHSGKIKLLFGALADQTLRAKFRVVVSPNATFSAERIKQEIVNVINRYFEITNWDFGSTFYATELLSLIHQTLPTQIASVVIVPTYSVNSFGSLFTIAAGLDEILQSCATIEDVEIVPALTPAMLRQNV